MPQSITYKGFSFVLLLAVIALMSPQNLTRAMAESESSCITCHTHFGKLKKNLTKTTIQESELIEGMG